MAEVRRNPVIDATKGTAICLMVFGHCLQYGVQWGEIGGESGFFSNDVFSLIYSFHMPLFMLLSGYLFSFGVTRWKTGGERFRKPFRTLLTPVSTVAVLTIVCGWLSGKGVYWERSLHVWISTLWFLWAVFYCSLAVLAVRKLFNDAWWAYALLAAVALETPDCYLWHLHKFMYVYFVAAYLFGQGIQQGRAPGVGKVLTMPVLGAVGVAYIGCLCCWEVPHYVYVSGVTLLGRDATQQLSIDLFRWAIGFLGSWVCLGLVYHLWRLKIVPRFLDSLLQLAGRCSLGIYIFSTLILDGIVKLGLSRPLRELNYAVVILQFGIVLAMSIFLTLAARRWKLSRGLLLGGR